MLAGGIHYRRMGQTCLLDSRRPVLVTDTPTCSTYCTSLCPVCSARSPPQSQPCIWLTREYGILPISPALCVRDLTGITERRSTVRRQVHSGKCAKVAAACRVPNTDRASAGAHHGGRVSAHEWSTRGEVQVPSTLLVHTANTRRSPDRCLADITLISVYATAVWRFVYKWRLLSVNKHLSASLPLPLHSLYSAARSLLLIDSPRR